MIADHEPDDATLTSERTALLGYFSDRAKADNLVISPRGADRDLNLVRRFYWEHNDEREFSIAWGNSPSLPIDGFVKRTGINYERELLYVMVGVGSGLEPLLWRLYRGWIRDGMNEAEAMSLIAKAPPPVRD